MNLKFPERLSYDFLQMFSFENDSSYESYRLYKGVTFSMIKIIVKATRNQKESSDDYDSTDKGNQILHAVCAFSDDLTIVSNMSDRGELFNCKNANGWTPFFVAKFRNNKILKKLELSHFIDQGITDYFGNTANFYAKH